MLNAVNCDNFFTLLLPLGLNYLLPQRNSTDYEARAKASSLNHWMPSTTACCDNFGNLFSRRWKLDNCNGYSLFFGCYFQLLIISSSSYSYWFLLIMDYSSFIISDFSKPKYSLFIFMFPTWSDGRERETWNRKGDKEPKGVISSIVTLKRLEE